MSVAELVNCLQDSEEFDLKASRDAIHREAGQPCTEDERIILIKLYNAVWDRAERGMADSAPEKQQERKNLRLSDYRLLILKEATIGENICAETLHAVTEREIAAGRMAPDDSLHTLAVERISGPHPSRAEMIALAQAKAQPKKRGLLSRLFGI